MKNELLRLDEPSRRAFMQRLAKTCLGVSLIPRAGLAAAPNQTSGNLEKHAKHVIYLYMRGGMSHIDTFDPKPNAPAGYQGPVRTIQTKAPGLQLSNFFPLLAEQGQKIAVVRSMTHTQGAHEEGSYKVMTGFETSVSMRHPALGAWVARQVVDGHSTLPPYIRLGGLAGHPSSGFLDARYAPVPVLDPSKGIEHTKLQGGDSMTALRRRTSLADRLNQGFMQKYPTDDVKAHVDVYADAVKLMTSKELDAFDLSQEKSQVVEDYGGGDYFGRGVLLARRLVERGTKFVEVELGGWDTHTNNFAQVEGLAKRVDQSVSALLADLEERGLLESTLVVLTTEFGRTPKLSGDGRDHHPIAFSSMIAGGQVRGGQAYGKTDVSGTRVEENPVSVLDFHSTIGTLLGIRTDDMVSAGSAGNFNIHGGNGARRGRTITELIA
ncbi:DUF1501 domain-containing protein [Brevifollis gellanilyticus]|uniref:Sulfatase n=1 Tax=Brevifollis gellanilyticus TaxID=748831 RepID=A0A512MAD4_9BACT|nr:DUF1501 domain-containing protein [Brevifollis gellanilyticus]GEP43301.1 hypothetical protein BGE01nite_25920 [Brevifollis gellanilyticus]